MIDRNKDPKFAVSRDRAREHVQLSLNIQLLDGISGFKGVRTTSVNKEPLIIYDLNGQELFYEFDIIEEGKIVGSAKASADRSVGSTVPQIKIGPRKWNSNIASSKAEDEAKKKFPGSRIIKSELVCYCYPKIGVRVYLDDPNAGETSLIFDVGSYSIVEPEETIGAIGSIAYSYLDEIASAEILQRERRWELQDRLLAQVKAETPNFLEGGMELRDLKDIGIAKILSANAVYQPNKADISTVVAPISFISQRVIKFCKHCTTHDCFALHAQKTDTHCAVASGQMLLDFYRYYYTQDQIATEMGYIPGAGCYIDGIVDGLENLTHNCMNIVLDSSPTWSSAAAEINQNRPLMTTIPGHARTCFGWKRANIWAVSTPRPLWLYILDPWLWNADICAGGEIYWEDWYAITHLHFVYLRHRTTPCR